MLAEKDSSHPQFFMDPSPNLWEKIAPPARERRHSPLPATHRKLIAERRAQ